MKQLKDFYKKTGKLHHAYCINASGEEVKKQVFDFVEKEIGFKTQGNPDFWFAEFDTLNVESGRMIKDNHFQKPTMGDLRISVIYANFITEQAQNAMLKMFEEPSGGTCFFLISPSAGNLLPTLKSRMIFVSPDLGSQKSSATADSQINPKDFLSSNLGERLKLIKDLLDDISDEKESRIQAINFLNSLESEFYKKTQISQATPKELFILEELEKCRSYASDPAPSLKILLEHLALII